MLLFPKPLRVPFNADPCRTTALIVQLLFVTSVLISSIMFMICKERSKAAVTDYRGYVHMLYVSRHRKPFQFFKTKTLIESGMLNEIIILDVVPRQQ